jgi:sugar lactone lactonase YvrE
MITHTCLALGLALLLALLGFHAEAQAPGTITTVAGSGTAGFAGDGGPATAAQLSEPPGVAVDPAGNLFIADRLNHRVRMVAADTGIITTVAGTGTAGFGGDGGPATGARLSVPRGVALDASGNLFIADFGNARVRKVEARTAIITTVAGGGATLGDGGPATSARVSGVAAVALDATGNMFIAEQQTHRVRMVAAGTGIITTIAGIGTSGFSGDGGPATGAQLASPTGVAVDASGNLFIAEGSRIRKVAAGTGIIATVAGGGREPVLEGNPAVSAGIGNPAGVALDASGNLFIASRSHNTVYKVGDTGIIRPVAGTGVRGFGGDGGPATGAQLDPSPTFGPFGLAVDRSGNLFIADVGNHRIRKVAAEPGLITTAAGTGAPGFSGDGGPATGAQLKNPRGIVVGRSGNLFIVDTDNHRVRKVEAETGVITTVVGTGVQGFGGDGGPATSAQLAFPTGLAMDARGDLFIADLFNYRVRKIAAGTGLITTVAGSGPPAPAPGGFAGDGSPATGARLNLPRGVALDASGNLFIADSGNARVRKVAAGTGIITTVAGTGTAGFAGDGGPATSAQLGGFLGVDGPGGVGVDASGDLFIADSFNNRIRKVSAGTGIITTVAGGGTGDRGDGGPATSARLSGPASVALDSTGNLFIADPGHYRIRKVDADTGAITTVAGTGRAGTAPEGFNIGGFGGDGGPPTSAQLNGPTGLALDAAGNLFVADAGNHRIRKVSGLGTCPDAPPSPGSPLTISQARGGAGDMITFTVTGTAGENAVVAFSRANSGRSFRGQALLLGADLGGLFQCTLPGAGSCWQTFAIPSGVSGTFFFQAARSSDPTFQAGTFSLTNAACITIQ